MKRLRDGPSSSSGLDQKKALLTDTIKSLTAPESDGGPSNLIQPTNEPREVDFLLRIHRWLTGGKGKVSQVQSNKNEGQEKGCILELKSQVEMLDKRVQELERQNKCERRLVSNILKTALPFPETKLVGSDFEENAAQLMGWLKHSQACMIGVWGMGGVGKTALVTHIYNQLIRDATLSWPVCWIDVSQCDNVCKWQESLAKCFELDMLDEEDKMKRRSKLYDAFTKMGNIVLILDEMWQPFSVHEVGIPLGENGCKIILTTRSLEVCRRMGCKDLVIDVHTLLEGEAWALFVEKHGNYETLTQEVKCAAREVANRCGGLPLAIVTMADHMIGEDDINEWHNTLSELESHKQDKMNEKVFSRLQCSFDRLNDEMVKKCFLSSVFFISHYELYSESELIDHLIYEGLLDEMGSKGKQLRRGHTILNKLAKSCLLDPESEVHDLIKGMVIHFQRGNHPCFTVKGCLKLREKSEDEPESNEDLMNLSLCEYFTGKALSPECPNLTVLIMEKFNSPVPVMIPESLIVHMNALRILDFSKTKIGRLPNSVSGLKNLRVLLLRFCRKLTLMPSLTKLIKLKVLDLSGAHGIKEAPMGMENLKWLEKLYFNWHISDLTHFNKLIGSWAFSPSLCCNFVIHNGLCDSDSWEFDDDGNMQILGVELSDKNATPLLPPSIKRLTIAGCNIKGRESLSDALPSLDGASMLKQLHVEACRGMEYILPARRQGPSIFPQLSTLEELDVISLPDCKGIIRLEGTENTLSSQTTPLDVALPRLKNLNIDGCPKMKNVFVLNLVEPSLQLSHLERVRVHDCEDLEELFESSNKDISSAGNCNLILSNLRDLYLGDLPKLGSVCRGLRLYTSLSTLTIFDCNAIKEVFSLDLLRYPQPLLPNLKAIDVADCQNLEQIFASPTSNPILILPNLSRLQLRILPKLRNIYRGILVCPRLEEADILDCPNYKQMGGLSKALICDASPLTLASFPSYNANREWWEPISRDYPEDTSHLLARLDEFWRGLNLETVTSPQISSLSVVGVGNQGFHLPNDVLNQSATQSFSHVVQSHTEQISAINAERWRTGYFGSGHSMSNDSNVMPPAQLPHIEPALVNDQGSSYAAGYETDELWDSQHQQFSR